MSGSTQGAGRRPGDAPLDWWTVPHALSGAALGFVLPLRWVLIALVAFECIEAVLRCVGRQGRGLFEHESAANIAADIVVGMAAALLVHALRAPIVW